MDSAEGRGLARRAWDRYAEAVRGTVPESYVKRVLKPFGAGVASDLLGFWLVWHTQGGFEGLRELGMSRATIYRKIKKFRQITGQHPDEFRLAGVSIDLRKHLAPE